jgi:CheY-like chemotaxis protein
MAVIREHRPDVLITDILMPELDGWEILSMVRRDVLLWDTPVVVLSWREDFLQRLRDLEVEANAYLLKESDRSHILASVSETVAERRQIAQRVSESDDASGRVEQIGIVPLLDALAGRRGTARLVVRETWNVFEVTLRMRTVLDVRHLVDGMPRESGVSALRLLLGVRSGRFTVSTPLWREDGAVLGPYDQTLAAAARPFQELVDLVTNGVFLRSTTLALRPELLPRYLETTPRRVHMVVDALRTGSQPIELIAEGRVTLSAMESIMLDMVRRGIVLEMHPQADHIATSS